MAHHHPAPDAQHLTPTRSSPPASMARAGFASLHAHGLALVAFVALATGVAVAALLATSMSGLAIPVLGADPTPAPTDQPAAPLTCADRFPAEGPAGVDLRLGCIVSEVVGLYTSGQSTPPPPLSTYAILVAGVALSAIVAAWFVGRLVARRAGRRLAPVLAAEWWICDSCRSVNGSGVSRCYSCGSGRPDGPMLTTDEHPGISQSFGNRRKQG